MGVKWPKRWVKPDLRDAHIYGGALFATLASGFLWGWAVGLLFAGLLLLVLGLFSRTRSSDGDI